VSIPLRGGRFTQRSKRRDGQSAHPPLEHPSPHVPAGEHIGVALLGTAKKAIYSTTEPRPSVQCGDRRRRRRTHPTDGCASTQVIERELEVDVTDQARSFTRDLLPPP
jgi:hypothetical protein